MSTNYDAGIGEQVIWLSGLVIVMAFWIFLESWIFIKWCRELMEEIERNFGTPRRVITVRGYKKSWQVKNPPKNTGHLLESEKIRNPRKDGRSVTTGRIIESRKTPIRP